MWKKLMKVLFDMRFAIFMGLFISGVTAWTIPTHSEQECTSTACHEAAKSIKYNMDASVDPCDNLYKFACGGFINKTHIPDDEQGVTSFTAIENKVMVQIREILMRQPREEEPRFYGITKDYFKSCINDDSSNRRGNEVMQNVIEEIGGWPILEHTERPIEDYGFWYEKVGLLRQKGLAMDNFVSINIRPDYKDSSTRVIDVDNPKLEISKELWEQGENNSIIQAYKLYMRDAVELFGGNVSLERVKRDMQDILDFEESLARASLLLKHRRDNNKLHNPMLLGNLSSLDPYTPWKKILQQSLDESLVQLSENDIVNVAVPSFINSLSKLTGDTPKRIQNNYMIWRIVSSKMSSLSSEARDIRFKYLQQRDGISQMPERWKTCIARTQMHLDNAIGAMYVREYFDREAKNGAEGIVMALREAFKEGLSDSEWIDKTTKVHALEKLKVMTQNIGYPEELLDDEKLNERYNRLQIHPDELFENEQRINKFHIDYSVSLLRQKVNKADWVQNGIPTTVNAFYDPSTNSISFPAGILQGRFFSGDRPESLNYGSLGWIAGHEITHGFDDSGCQFDMNGNLRNWWEASTMDDFKKKSQCFVDQYSQYEFNGLKLNGLNTQGENIADNGGIKFAYKAYTNWLSANPSSPQRLPGLSFTAKQLFWISATNVWCSKNRPELTQSLILMDEHSPPMYRIIGAISNKEDFLKDFQCSPGHRSLNSCEVW